MLDLDGSVELTSELGLRKPMRHLDGLLEFRIGSTAAILLDSASEMPPVNLLTCVQDQESALLLLEQAPQLRQEAPQDLQV